VAKTIVYRIRSFSFEYIQEYVSLLLDIGYKKDGNFVVLMTQDVGFALADFQAFQDATGQQATQTAINKVKNQVAPILAYLQSLGIIDESVA
jgi:hypothetical protein